MRAGAGTWLAGAAVYLIAEAVTATGVKSYSYLDDYISELGVSGLMNRAFMLHGVLFLIGAVLVVRSVRLGWMGRAFVIAAAVNASEFAILAALPWRPQRDDLDTIVKDALAWERKLAERRG